MASQTITVTFDVGNSRHVLSALRRRRIDFGFIEGAQTPSGVEGAVIGTDRLVVIALPAHLWARSGSVTPQHLAKTPLVCREEGSGTREVLERSLTPLTLAPPALVVHSNAAVRTAVLGGVGPTVISELAVAEDLRSGRLVEVSVNGIELRRRLLAVWNAPRQSRFDDALMHLRVS